MATKSGFVQRLLWLSGGPSACVWIGDAANSAEIFLVAIQPGDGNATIKHKQSIVDFLSESYMVGRKVDVFHGSTSSYLTGAATTPINITANPIQIDAIEVTQGIQDLGQSVPLIAGKRTVVRVYVSTYGGSAVTVSGQLSIRRTPGTTMLVNSENIVNVQPAQAGDIPAKRDDASLSLNFVLPAGYATAGQVQVDVAALTNTVSGTPLTFQSNRRPTVWFHAAPPMRVRVIGMRYTQGTPPATFTPQPIDFNLVLSWLQRAYPVSGLQATTITIDADAAPPFTCGDINAQVAAIRAVDMSAGGDARTHYYGLVSDGGFFMRGCAGVPATPNPAAVGSGPTGPGTWGWDFDGSYGDWYTGHELGHTLGRRHPGFCGETLNDLDNYPFSAGQLADSNMSFAGFDVGDPANSLGMAALPGTQWHDVMTYCDRQWLSPYTYLGILQRLRDEDALGATGTGSGSPSPGSGAGGRPDERFVSRRGIETPPVREPSDQQLVSIVATANLSTREAKIKYVNPLDRGVPTEPSVDSPIHLRAIGPSGEVLTELPVALTLSSEVAEEDEQVGIVDAVMYVPGDARSIELLIGRTTIDHRSVGGPLPAMRGLRTSAGARGRLAVELDNIEEYSDNCTYTVQISRDDGRTWETTAVGLSEPSFSLEGGEFKEGDVVQVKVIATNGLQKYEMTTEEVFT